MSKSSPVFIHAADLHLGSPLRRLGDGLDPGTKKRLVEKARAAFDALVAETITRRAEFLVLAGDIYDNAEQEASEQIRLRNGLQSLIDHGIKVYMVHGNHDPLADDVVNVVKLPDDVVVFQPGEVGRHEHKLRDGGHVLISGISFRDKHESENLALKFRGLERGNARAIIGVLHTNVGGKASGHQDYAPCTASDLRDSPVDYWALGHVHKTTIEDRGNNQWWAYPGNLQGRDFGETGPRGALVVPILDRGVGRPQLLELDQLRFERIELEFDDGDNDLKLDGIALRVAEQLKSQSLERETIIELRLTGRSDIRRVFDKITKQSANGTSDQLASSIQSELLRKGLTRVHIGRVVDHVLPQHNIEQLESQNDLCGDLLRHVHVLSYENYLSELPEDLRGNFSAEDFENAISGMRSRILSQLAPQADADQ